MTSYRSTEKAEDRSSTNIELVSENSSNDDGEEDQFEDQCEMDDDSVNGEDDLVYQQDQAFEKLTDIFQLLNISPNS